MSFAQEYKPVLAAALPLSLQDLLRQLAEPSDFDYARAMQGLAGGLTSDFVWETQFKPVVDHLDALRPELAELGVQLAIGIGRHQLKSTFFHSGLLTLLAHWKGCEVLPDDLVNPVTVAEEISRAQNRVCQTLRTLMDISVFKAPLSVGNFSNQQRGELARQLTHAIKSGKPLFKIPLGQRLALVPEELHGLNRDQIDAWFSEERIVPGNRLELADGLVTAAEFSALIPEDYAGTIHLANCHSVLLQRAVSRPTRRIVANQGILPPITTLELYVSVIRACQLSNQSYEDIWIETLTVLRDPRQRETKARFAENLMKPFWRLVKRLRGYGD